MSPIGHTCCGLSVYLGYCALRKKHPSSTGLATCLFFSMSPDLDLVTILWLGLSSTLDYHHQYTHTPVFALLMGLFVLSYDVILRKDIQPMRWISPVMLTSFHILTDYLTRYTDPSYGVMLGWPFVHTFFQGPVFFLEIYQTSLDKLLSMANLKAIVHEIFIFIPAVSWPLFLTYTHYRTDTVLSERTTHD